MMRICDSIVVLLKFNTVTKHSVCCKSFFGQIPLSLQRDVFGMVTSFGGHLTTGR